MDDSEDNVFFGPVTVNELEYLYKKKVRLCRRTDCFLPASEFNNFIDDNTEKEESEESFLQKEQDGLLHRSSHRVETPENSFSADDLQNPCSEINKSMTCCIEEECNDQNIGSPEPQCFFQIKEDCNTSMKLTPESALLQSSNPPRRKVSENTPHVTSTKEYLSFSNSVESKPPLQGKQNASFIAEDKHDSPLEISSMKNNSHYLFKRNTEHDSIPDAFEDINLVSLPPGGDFTLTPDKTSVNQVSPVKINIYQIKSLHELSALKESDELDTSDKQCISPTPCNTTAGSDTYCPKVAFSEDHCIPETPCNSVDYSEHPSELDKSNLTEGRNTSNECKILPEDTESTLFYSSPEKDVQRISKKMDANRENCRINDCSFAADDINIITINCNDDTNLSMLAAPKEECDAKENVCSSENINNKSDPKEQSMYSWTNKVQVPEMTEEQQNLLRQLWCSPQPEKTEVSDGSPLMNALDLSSTNEHALAGPKGSKSSLATLDLSVDDRIPVMTYINQINSSKFTPTSELEKNLPVKSEKRQLPFRLQKTPMSLVSNKVGIINVPTDLPSPKMVKENSRTEKQNQITPVKAVARYSGIPVPKSSATKPPLPDFKNPNLIHGINTYKSRVPVKGRLFSTPSTPSKKWNVASPVAKYINEDPVQPLVKIIRPKEQKALPVKSQTSANSKVAVSVPPSPEKVPAAHYKLRQTTSNNDVVRGSDKSVKSGRFFPSPYTPKVTRHEGAKKGIPGAQNISLQRLQMNSSDAKLNKSTIQTVALQRTNTLFKPLEY